MKSHFQHKLRRNFDRATSYGQHAVIQKKTACELIEKIASYFQDRSPKTILDLGCGDGLLTRLLCEKWPSAHIVAADFSPKMLERAKDRLPESNVSFRRVDINHKDTSETFDLVCSNMAFQWTERLEACVKQWFSSVNPDGLMALSFPVGETFSQWKQTLQHVGKQDGVRAFPDYQAVTNWDFYPAQAQWFKEEYQQIFPSAGAFLSHLKKTGTSLPRADYHPLNRHELSQACDYFNSHFLSTIDWAIAFGFLRKPPCEGVFVTGTDTDIGKTLSSACMVRAWGGHYWKLFQTGMRCDEGDLNEVIKLTGTSSYSPSAGIFEEPLCPEDAAAHQHEIIDVDKIALPPKEANQPLIIEGAGGVMVPVTKTVMMIDLIKKIGLPVIIVSRSDVLGTINHTLLTIEALRSRHIAIAGVVLNGKVNEGHKRQIQQKGKVRILAQLPYCHHLTKHSFLELSQEIPSWRDVW